MWATCPGCIDPVKPERALREYAYNIPTGCFELIDEFRVACVGQSIMSEWPLLGVFFSFSFCWDGPEMVPIVLQPAERERNL